MRQPKIIIGMLSIVIALMTATLALIVSSPNLRSSGKGFKTATQTYARLETRDKKGKIISSASGVILNDKLILSCAHMLRDAKNHNAFFEGEKLRTIGYDRNKDLALFKANTSERLLANTQMAKVAVPGTEVYDCSNANTNSGTLGYYFIKRSAVWFDKVERVDLDKPIIPGESGAGLFDSKGRLVGIFVVAQSVSYAPGGDSVLYGIAIGPKTIAEFLSGIQDPDCNEYYQEVIVKN